MKRAILAVLLVVSPVLAETVKKSEPVVKKVAMPDVFYVYVERGSRENHYIPAGWMGDFGDLKFNQGFMEKGKNVINVIYSAQRKQGAGWSGIYWQVPANNWGDKRGGFDLSSYTKLKFLARGATGGEYIDKFMIGGITGQTEEGDSDTAATDALTLTKDWKEYTIDLKGLDMKHIIGGFGFALNADSNPSGASFFLDKIRLEK